MHVMVIGPASADGRNAGSFELACSILRHCGHIPHNPLELCLEGSPFAADIAACEAMLDECRGIALLGGWEESMGAALLVERARKRCYSEIGLTWIEEERRCR